MARQRLGHGRDLERAGGESRGRQQRALDLGGEPQLVLHPLLDLGLAVQARVLDRHGRLGGELIEGGVQLGFLELAQAAAVDVEHAQRLVARAAHLGERGAQHGADAIDHRVAAVGHFVLEHQVARLEHARRHGVAAADRLGLDRATAAVARHANDEALAAGAFGREHDEAAIGARQGDGLVDDDGEHFLEHASLGHRLERLAEQVHRAPADHAARLGVLGQRPASCRR